MKKTKSTFALILVATALVFFFGFGAAQAAQQGDEGLTLSPPLKELTLNPGETSTQTLTLTNPTSKLVELYPKIMDFGAKDETGQPTFTQVGETSSKFSLSSWILLSTSKIALTTNQVVQYSYEIKVPLNAEPGGHYGSVLFATEPPKPEGNTSKVVLGSMVGSLVLVRVPGDIVENGTVVDFSVNKGIYLDNKVIFDTRISNTGNTHFRPAGDILIRNMFGRVVDDIKVNSEGGNVLPETIRKFDYQWSSKSILFGPYTAEIKLVYGESSKTLDARTAFWILPIWILVILLLAFIATVTTVILIIKKRKSAKKLVESTKKPDYPIRPSSPGPSGPIILR